LTPGVFGELAQVNRPLWPYCTLRAGGSAQILLECRTVDAFAEAAKISQQENIPMLILGWGSNVLPSDEGVPGVTAVHLSREISIDPSGEIEVDCGAGLQDLFLKTAQAGLSGFSFAVGIPGTVGGALVSNAGAYRTEISKFVTEIEVVYEGVRRWVGPEFMAFRYRDSFLRSTAGVQCALLRVRMRLESGDRKQIFDDARDFQRQRISKQPPIASAGSFFKNVNDFELAQTLDDLTEGMRKAGVVPAGFLLQRCGMMGYRLGGAMLAKRHANFMVNTGRAKASDIRSLAQVAKSRVQERFGVELEEEVLYVGDWTSFEPSVPTE